MFKIGLTSCSSARFRWMCATPVTISGSFQQIIVPPPTPRFIAWNGSDIGSQTVVAIRSGLSGRTARAFSGS